MHKKDTTFMQLVCSELRHINTLRFDVLVGFTGVACCAGDKVVTFRYGQFSHLWIDMMQRLGLDVHVIEERWGDGADEEKLAQVHGSQPDIAHVWAP
jgi:hypothetical protein